MSERAIPDGLREGLTSNNEKWTEIVASCQQTRFHLADNDASTQVDIKGLNIAIVSSKPGSLTKSAKFKAAGEEKPLLSDAHLRLKSGVHYCLLGRNGSGKSTLLRALAERIIPGVPDAISIALLQQTSTDPSGYSVVKETVQRVDNDAAGVIMGETVLQHVIEQNAARRAIIHDLNILSTGEGDSEDPRVQVQRYRRLCHERLQRRLFKAQRNALHRSGSRGMHARKELLMLEQQVVESKESLNDEIQNLGGADFQIEMQDATATIVDLQAQLDAISLVDLESKARNILCGLGFKEPSLQKPFTTLSGGWEMRCQLASVLIEPANILILDEPTNFLDMQGIVWLQRFLVDLLSDPSKTVLIVSHDRDFVDNVCGEVIILEDQVLKYFQGNLTAYEIDFRSRVLYLTRMKETQDNEASRIKKTIATAIKQGKQSGDDNKLRMAKSRQKKLENQTGMQVGANGSRFKLNRDRVGRLETKLAAIEIPKSEQEVSLSIPVASDLRFPGSLVSLEDLEFAYSKGIKPVLRGCSLSISMGDRVGVVGLNGCGKSTLLKLITGALTPTKGTITRHPRLKLGYYSQHEVEDVQARARANPDVTALGMLSTECGEEMTEQDMRGLLGSFGLPGRTASNVPVAKLSGGQLVRLSLVFILWKHPNLLVLDEVTTHLDYRTIIALAEALSNFNGAILLVTHDRFMVRTVIEDEWPISEDEDGGDLEEPEDENCRQRTVYLIDKATLVRQDNGVSDFERKIEKKVALSFV